jgi:DNA-binding IclR family transcriptional regulator
MGSRMRCRIAPQASGTIPRFEPPLCPVIAAWYKSRMSDNPADPGTEPDPDRASDQYYALTVGKALGILEAFVGGPAEMSLAEVCRRVGLNRATAYRLLYTLASHRLIARAADGRYRLGLGLVALGSTAQRGVALGRVALPHMHALTEQLWMTSFLSVQDGAEALCLERIDGGEVYITRYQEGERLPLHAGAGPLVLLAGLPDEEVGRILEPPPESLTRYTVTERDAVRERVDLVRRDDVAFSDQDVTVGIGAIGVPIRDGTGRVVAALSVSGVIQVLFGERQAAIVGALHASAAAIGRELS